ncbi:hypothetical protein LUW77_30160 [Streptomyces radiopugnans]|nr:hypothetical protein LUW77_30160 [Streptomyces radiopugnans]
MLGVIPAARTTVADRLAHTGGPEVRTSGGSSVRSTERSRSSGHTGSHSANAAPVFINATMHKGSSTLLPTTTGTTAPGPAPAADSRAASPLASASNSAYVRVLSSCAPRQTRAGRSGVRSVCSSMSAVTGR